MTAQNTTPKPRPDKSLERLTRYIRGLLKKQGVWDGTQGYQIELVATDIIIYRRLRERLLSEDIVIVEKSREGDDRVKPNPLIFQLREQSKLVSKGLDMLWMNVKSKGGKTESADAFASFMDGLNDD